MPSRSDLLYLNLDDAWPAELALPARDLREWGARLRFSAPAREMESFDRSLGKNLPPFLIFGSGDFHHLTALFARRHARLTNIVSFDNHPDWDIRPPRWGCGGWVNRALEWPQIEKVSVWGCGNFECWWPRQIFGNRRAERGGRLDVHPWADDRSPREKKRRGVIFAHDWRQRFSEFVRQLGEKKVYVTIDLDCLREGHALTNWENGRFGIEDLLWALRSLGKRIAAGDICGAWSPPVYARAKQRFVAEMDHPKVPPRDLAETQRRNLATLRALLPALTERNECDAEADDK